uniref:Ig-like domain-containing protein n=1 Tax=Astyanax mexicanus TaxID=7994 RepID=A0A8B9KFU8_ASTMX
MVLFDNSDLLVFIELKNLLYAKQNGHIQLLLNNTVISRDPYKTLIFLENWSMTIPQAVKQIVGEDAVLPCSFTTPYTSYQNITVVWHLKDAYDGAKCLSTENPSDNGQNCTESIGRYSLAGNPRSKNISLRIKDVSFSEDGQYFCCFELIKKEDTYRTKTGTRLSVQSSTYGPFHQGSSSLHVMLKEDALQM